MLYLVPLPSEAGLAAREGREPFRPAPLSSCVWSSTSPFYSLNLWKPNPNTTQGHSGVATPAGRKNKKFPAKPSESIQSEHSRNRNILAPKPGPFWVIFPQFLPFTRQACAPIRTQAEREGSGPTKTRERTPPASERY